MGSIFFEFGNPPKLFFFWTICPILVDQDLPSRAMALRCHRGAVEGGDQDQPVAVSARDCLGMELAVHNGPCTENSWIILKPLDLPSFFAITFFSALTPKISCRNVISALVDGHLGQFRMLEFGRLICRAQVCGFLIGTPLWL